MKQMLMTILLYLTGVIPLFLSVPRKYYLISPGKNWSDAQVYCRANYTDLATFDNDDDLVELQNKAEKQNFTGAAWIGLYKIYHKWRWSYGNISLGNGASWYQGTPYSVYGNYECGVTDNLHKKDSPCTSKLPFLCFDDRLTGDDRYVYYSNKTSWHHAQIFCKENHVDLANNADPTEMSVVQSKVSGYTWVGLHRSSWTWSDQTNPFIIPWAPTQPDNVRTENCTFLNNTLVDDTPCTVVRPFFCYRIITGQQQMIRIKLQSGQDLNNPTVKEAILQKIQEKLKEHGLENVGVTFRVRAVKVK